MKRLNKIIIFVAILFMLSSISCREQDNYFCTEEFRTISVTVIGDKLDDYYTVRISNNDTIRYENDVFFDENTYLILDDNYKNYILNKTEIFIFHGIINDSIVIKEEYEISADRCHINYISGKTEILL